MWYLIDNVQVSHEVFDTYFQCDYKSCHGACCYVTLPDTELLGGSLLDAEAQEISAHKDELLPLLTKKQQTIINAAAVDDHKGTYYTPLESNGTCAYCTNHGCVFKEAQLSFKIPLSCGLYPLCIDKEPTLRLYVSHLFDKWCESSYTLGRKNRIKVYQWCKDALIRAFGESFYRQLEDFPQYRLPL